MGVEMGVHIGCHCKHGRSQLPCGTPQSVAMGVEMGVDMEMGVEVGRNFGKRCPPTWRGLPMDREKCKLKLYATM
ncbi:MAG: hypothetical protein U9N87_02320 [Planctomycetota bacterium]|nr:hypothetical protein [Planctomycetota bacterium]